MIDQDPAREVSLYRDGQSCLGYLSRDGVLYYAKIEEVNVDAVGYEHVAGMISEDA